MKVFLVVDVQSFFNFFVLLSNAFMLELVLFSGFLPSCTHNLCSLFFPLSLPAFLLFLIIFGGVFWVT